MKRLLLTLFSLALVGCIEPNSILLLNAEHLDNDCSASGTYIYGGTVEAGTSNYYVAFDIQSELDNTDITVNGLVINPGSRNDYIAQVAILNYVNASTGASLGIPEQHISMSAVIPAHARAGDNWIMLNLLNPTVAGMIAAAGQVAVQVHLSGRLASANTALMTNTVQFPLTVYTFDPVSCTQPLPADAPCGNIHQDIVCN
jgi:hypothetical protein